MSEQEANAPTNLAEFYFVNRSQPLSGELTVPGDKSISQRAVIFSAIAEGDSEIEGLLEADDTYATINSLRSMGAEIINVDEGYWVVRGVGLFGLSAPNGPLSCHHCGTSMRLLLGLLAGQSFDSELTGEDRLLNRSMNHVIEPLTKMGANISMNADGTGPFVIKGSQQLVGSKFSLPLASHHTKSSILLAALYAQGQTMLIEPFSTRNHTEQMLKLFQYDINIFRPSITMNGGGRLQGTYVNVPGDISIAAYFMVAATIVPGSDILIHKVGLNETRIGVINILRIMGAHIHIENEEFISGERIADVRVRYAQLQGVDIPIEQVPFAIDEFPVLFVAAACAKGTTILREAEELRLKESDRIHAMANGLRRLGVELETRKDGIVITGGNPITGGRIASLGDSRIALAFAVAGLVAEDQVMIEDCGSTYDTFPEFIELAAQIGFEIKTENE